MSQLTIAAERARQWLQNINTDSNEMAAMREVGLLFCTRMIEPMGAISEGSREEINLSSPISLINMNRGELLALMRDISLSPQKALPNHGITRDEWAKVLGGLALSYAHYGDISVVAALVRVSAALNLAGTLLLEAHDYLMDQQQPDGTFGLLSREMKQIQSESNSIEEVKLRLTVEVLWALAEVGSMTH